jgi:hypothetical protein
VGRGVLLLADCHFVVVEDVHHVLFVAGQLLFVEGALPDHHADLRLLYRSLGVIHSLSLNKPMFNMRINQFCPMLRDKGRGEGKK